MRAGSVLNAPAREQRVVLSTTKVACLPRPPNVPGLRALWYLLDGIWGLLKVVGGCWL